jgi:hypothetical protein
VCEHLMWVCILCLSPRLCVVFAPHVFPGTSKDRPCDLLTSAWVCAAALCSPVDVQLCVCLLTRCLLVAASVWPQECVTSGDHRSHLSRSLPSFPAHLCLVSGVLCKVHDQLDIRCGLWQSHVLGGWQMCTSSCAGSGASCYFDKGVSLFFGGVRGGLCFTTRTCCRVQKNALLGDASWCVLHSLTQR